MWRVILVLGFGCGRQLNPAWCAQHDSDPACRVDGDAGVDAGGDTGVDAAVDAGVGACQGSCPGAICLPEGACADPDTLLFASTAGTGAACTIAAPCALATAISQATAPRNVIALAPGTYLGAITIDRSVRIVGPNATLGGAAPGVAVTVTGAVAVELDEVLITGAKASALACTSGTLRAYAVRIAGNQQGITSACALTLERSIVSSNSTGALAITAGSIDVHDNFLVNNGSDTLKAGANVTIAGGVTGAFAFNTVAYNHTKNIIAGVDCQSAAVTADGNLVTDNTERAAFGGTQVVGMCDFTRSYTAPGAGGNDLRWVDVASGDFHLTAASTAVLDSPTLTCAGRSDFDGEPRPIGGGCDFGADELAPPH